MELFVESEKQTNFEEQMDKWKSETIEDEISLFAKLYFNKDIKDLTKEENHEIDCWGLYAISEWLIEQKK
jgi:hypothetical protein